MWAETGQDGKQTLPKGFQPTPPVWAETCCQRLPLRPNLHFNPLRPCGRRRKSYTYVKLVEEISTHSARVGGDQSVQHRPHRLHRFQPTPPVWAETTKEQLRYDHFPISTHSARVGGDFLTLRRSIKRRKFQPTPPVWAETWTPSRGRWRTRFQPTPPVWAETRSDWRASVRKTISTHSARVGGDL